ncbi:MAG: hypothetical protein IKN43_13160 [Selenomonadaceae bacterium]|nr:hypothetical protein [Selenomonadaceae bacterium]
MDFYKTLYQNCSDCAFPVVTLPNKSIRHFGDISSMEAEIERVGKTQNTSIHGLEEKIFQTTFAANPPIPFTLPAFLPILT